MPAPEPPHETSTAEFEVEAGGTLVIADFPEPKTRGDCYQSVWWDRTVQGLLCAMEECQPLAWAVHDLYTDAREALLQELENNNEPTSAHEGLDTQVKARLQAMPEEPEEGVETWLMSLTAEQFEEKIVPAIELWFESEPHWNFESEYFDTEANSQGAAFSLFRSMELEELDAIGVVITEGEHPGSSYYAAELTIDVETANRAAIKHNIPVRFKKGDM